jgi:uncharacterized membrane protein YqjE
MSETTRALGDVTDTSRRLFRRLLTIGGNRIELLRLEVQEERERFLQAVVIGAVAVTLGLLACLTLTGAIVVLFWPYSPIGVLLGLTVIYGVAATALGLKVKSLFHDWHAFGASLDQFKKDCACLEKTLG